MWCHITIQSQRGETHRLRLPITGAHPIEVGRCSSATLNLTDQFASRRHCRLELKGDRVAVTNLSRTNPTCVNDTPVAHRVLAPGDVILAGRTRLQVTPEYEQPGPGDGLTGHATLPRPDQAPLAFPGVRVGTAPAPTGQRPTRPPLSRRPALPGPAPAVASGVRTWGPARVLQHLWEQLALPASVEALDPCDNEGRLERALFALVVQRLCGNNDLAGFAPGVAQLGGAPMPRLELADAYHACALLSEHRNQLEERIFQVTPRPTMRHLLLVRVGTTPVGGSCGAEPFLLVGVSSDGLPLTWQGMPAPDADPQRFCAIVNRMAEHSGALQLVACTEGLPLEEHPLRQLHRRGRLACPPLLICPLRRYSSEYLELPQPDTLRRFTPELELGTWRSEGMARVVVRDRVRGAHDRALREGQVARLKRALAAGNATLARSLPGAQLWLTGCDTGLCLHRAAIGRDEQLDGLLALDWDQPSAIGELCSAYRYWTWARRLAWVDRPGDEHPLHGSLQTIGVMALGLAASLQQRLDKKRTGLTWTEALRRLGEVHSVEGERGDPAARLVGGDAAAVSEVLMAAGLRPLSGTTHRRPYRRVAV